MQNVMPVILGPVLVVVCSFSQCVAFKSIKLQKDTVIVKSDSLAGQNRNKIKRISLY